MSIESHQNSVPNNNAREKLSALKSDPDFVETLGKNTIRAIGEVSNLIDTGSTTVTLNKPIEDLGEVGLDPSEKQAFQQELLTMVTSMDPENIEKAKAAFKNRLASLRSRITERIVGKSTEAITKNFESEESNIPKKIGEMVKNYLAKREAIYKNPDAQSGEKLDKLYEDHKGIIESQIARLDAYYEGRDTSFAIKGQALMQKALLIDTLGAFALQTTEGFKVGQIVHLQGQLLGKEHIKLMAQDTEALQTLASIEERPEGTEEMPEEYLSDQGKVGVIQVDKIKGIQLSAKIYRENGMTKADINNKTWYKPSQIHEMFDKGWIGVTDPITNKKTEFQANRYEESRKALEAKAKIEMKKGGIENALKEIGKLTQTQFDEIKKGMKNSIGINFTFENGKVSIDYNLNDNLTIQDQLDNILKLEDSINIINLQNTYRDETHPLKRMYLSAQISGAQGKPTESIQMLMEFQKDSNISEDPDIIALRKEALAKISTVRIFQVQELMEHIDSMPENFQIQYQAFAKKYAETGSIIKGLSQITDLNPRYVMTLCIKASTSGKAEKNDIYEKIADIFREEKSNEAAKYYYSKCFKKQFDQFASNPETVKKTEGAREHAQENQINKREALLTINSKTAEYLAEKNIVLNFDQLQKLQAGLLKKFMTKEFNTNKAVYEQMAKASDQGFLKSRAWSKFNEAYDPADELFNLTDEAEEFIKSELPYIAAEVGIVIISDGLATPLAHAIHATRVGRAVIKGEKAMHLLHLACDYTIYEVTKRVAILPFLAEGLGKTERAEYLRTPTSGSLIADAFLVAGAHTIDTKLMRLMKNTSKQFRKARFLKRTAQNLAPHPLKMGTIPKTAIQAFAVDAAVEAGLVLEKVAPRTLRSMRQYVMKLEGAEAGSAIKKLSVNVVGKESPPKLAHLEDTRPTKKPKDT